MYVIFYVSLYINDFKQNSKMDILDYIPYALLTDLRLMHRANKIKYK